MILHATCNWPFISVTCSSVLPLCFVVEYKIQCVVIEYLHLWKNFLNLCSLIPLIIYAEYFNFFSCFFLCRCFKVLETCEDLWCEFKKINPSVTWPIIYKCEDIPCLTHGWLGKMSCDIVVHKLEGWWYPLTSSLSWTFPQDVCQECNHDKLHWKIECGKVPWTCLVFQVVGGTCRSSSWIFHATIHSHGLHAA